MSRAFEAWFEREYGKEPFVEKTSLELAFAMDRTKKDAAAAESAFKAKQTWLAKKDVAAEAWKEASLPCAVWPR